MTMVCCSFPFAGLKTGNDKFKSPLQKAGATNFFVATRFVPRRCRPKGTALHELRLAGLKPRVYKSSPLRKAGATTYRPCRLRLPNAGLGPPACGVHR